MSERDRPRVEAALEGFFEMAGSWEFELAWKLCWLEKDFADAGWRGGPPAPPPPGWQRFTLVHGGDGDPRHDTLRARPPQGCVVDESEGCFTLRCERPGGRLLDAVAATCAEIRDEHGLLMSGLGADGPGDRGALNVGRLLLMAADRGPHVGYSVDDLARFLRTAGGADDAGT
ncbi:hypothetical protein ACR3S4_13805 [Streptomyces sp. CH8.1]|uniref:hypothetical protein n=1 Tax=Streptomyces TaxID=1883 RepID=UPI000ACD8073|nr:MULTISPECIES: hypothetical protein [Streptomyces]MCI4082250.1 hypothetical protein [Streptomyces sp. MMS21 TC-5]QNE26721.1 hypothetical protein F1D59_19645 [Streptomyces sp. INR7]RST10242.1 hypothetical protein EF904_13485 [Streptomyces sp. WAC05950]GLV90288.1 hypothetical protein Slala04_17420 [Streptomyces lavendulae subsp. lavendulae]